MPVAPVDDYGTHLYYEDTGAPFGSSDYVTLVLIHGALMRGASFNALIPYANRHRLRLVTLNMRDYPGSTPFSDKELAAMRGPDQDGQRKQLHLRGFEIAAFLLWFIRKENIPPFESDGGKFSGGISVLGWSWGNTMSLSFLARARELRGADRELLEIYMRGLIIYEPAPHSSISATSYFDEVHNPLLDQSLTKEEHSSTFLLWVSGYYAHSRSLLGSLASLTEEEVCAGIAPERLKDPLPHQTPTLQRMTPEERAATHAPEVWARSQVLYQPNYIDLELFRENTHTALQDGSVWPRLGVSLVWADMTVGEVILTSWDIAHQAKTTWPEGGRHVNVVRLPGGNHFPHMDLPELTTQILADCV